MLQADELHIKPTDRCSDANSRVCEHVDEQHNGMFCFVF